MFLNLGTKVIINVFMKWPTIVMFKIIGYFINEQRKVIYVLVFNSIILHSFCGLATFT